VKSLVTVTVTCVHWYLLQVFVDDNFDIIQTKCTCPRAEDVCHHRAALLLYAKDNLSKTDVPCRWVQRKQPTKVVSVDEMYPGTGQVAATDRPVDAADREWFRQELLSVNRFTGFAWLMSPEPEKVTTPVPTVSDIMMTEDYTKASDNVSFVSDRLPLTEEQIKEAEVATRGQSENSMWAIVRKGRLTASNFGPVLKCIERGRKPSKSLLRTLLGDYDLSSLRAVQWGTTHEKVAIEAYEKHTGNTVIASGICLSSSGCLGASPDGLVGEEKLIEVKCPFRFKSEHVVDHINDAGFFVCFNDDGELVLNMKSQDGHKYYHQVQGNLALTGRKVCDFCVWTPQDLVIFPVVRDNSWSENIVKLEQFYREHYLPVFLAGGL